MFLAYFLKAERIENGIVGKIMCVAGKKIVSYITQKNFEFLHLLFKCLHEKIFEFF